MTREVGGVRPRRQVRGCKETVIEVSDNMIWLSEPDI